jgi:hypothetical protein
MDLIEPVGRSHGRVMSPSQGHCLHRATQTQKKRGQTSVLRMGFEPTIPVFEWVKTFHVLDGAATFLASVGLRY